MKFKFLCLFLLIMFVHNQACARVDLEETIGAWEIYTVVDEMDDSKYFRYIFTGSLFEGSEFGISVGTRGDCSLSRSLSLLLGIPVDYIELKSKLLNKTKKLKFRVRVDKNTMMLVTGVEGIPSEGLTLVPINEDKVTNKKLIDQMLAGKELLIDFNPNNLSNIRPKVVSLSLDGFSKAYKRICKK